MIAPHPKTSSEINNLGNGWSKSIVSEKIYFTNGTKNHISCQSVQWRLTAVFTFALRMQMIPTLLLPRPRCQLCDNWFLVGMKSNDGLMVMIVGDDVNAAATTR